MFRFLGSFILLLLLIPVPSAYPLFGKPKPEKFFDLDKNGFLNRHERALLATHKHFGWELADSKKKKKFDYNSDWMLGPQEWEMYKKSTKGDKKIPLRVLQSSD